MKFLVHIGVNKTGTSSLQLAFERRRAALSAEGILYPATGVHLSGHHPISRALKGVPPASQGLAEDWEDRLRDEFGDHALCVLSSEDFATMADPAPLTQLCPPGETRIVLYLRDHARYLVSWYQQAIHSRNIAMSLTDYIASHPVNFAATLAAWSRVYGRDNVTVRLYDRETLKDGDIVADFCDQIRPGLARIFDGMTHASNPSLSGNLLFFKRILNPFLTREESLGLAYEFLGLSTLDPTFCGRLDVDADTVTRIRGLTRRDAAAILAETGLSLVPRDARIAGSPSPDLSRLEADLDRMMAFARDNAFALPDYVARMRGLAALHRAAG